METHIGGGSPSTRASSYTAPSLSTQSLLHSSQFSFLFHSVYEPSIYSSFHQIIHLNDSRIGGLVVKLAVAILHRTVSASPGFDSRPMHYALFFLPLYTSQQRCGGRSMFLSRWLRRDRCVAISEASSRMRSGADEMTRTWKLRDWMKSFCACTILLLRSPF